MMLDLKEKHNKKKAKFCAEISTKIKSKLESNGVLEERVQNAIIDKFTQHLKPKDYNSK